MLPNRGGRPKGSVNKSGHSAGGSRPGAGRKRLHTNEESVSHGAAEQSSSNVRVVSDGSSVGKRMYQQ